MNRYTAAVITVSDKASVGHRIDTSGPALKSLLEEHIWDVVYTAVVPDDMEAIVRELTRCADDKNISLILTTGGTGFAKRDVTPESALSVIEKQTPGIPEVMRAASMAVTDRACLSRSVAGIRRDSLIITLPGSRKAATENISSVLSPLAHAMELLASEGSADCGAAAGKVLYLCTSERKGTVKTSVDEALLVEDRGIQGDAHAGPGIRQISLLSGESVAAFERRLGRKLEPGAFGENILTEGILPGELPIGARIRVGAAELEITQLSKECHSGCEIKNITGDCIMPRDGIFAKVLKGGTVRPGDKIWRVQPDA